MEKGYLLLSDGQLYEGKLFGVTDICCGELVFNTSMSGYPEILTDPSYNGQIVLMTYPLIGNYGVDENWNESCGINATALVVKRLYQGPLPPDRISLDEFMRRHGRCGITDVDTRSLTLHIRRNGSQNAVSGYQVTLNGAGATADVVSRSVARDDSSQTFNARITGNAPCSGHTECDSIIMDKGRILAIPSLEANDVDAMLVHEAAIGKIAGDQLIKLMTLGLTEQEAEEQIINGFLR